MAEIYVDGAFFEFPSGWSVEKVDEWSEQKRLTSAPYEAKACDLLALQNKELWLVEAKDYTYPGVKMPGDLANMVGIKVFHTLALVNAVALWGSGPTQVFCKQALAVAEARVCLSVELKGSGRPLQGIEVPLANLRDKLKHVTRRMGVNRPVVSSSVMPNGVPWSVRRDPETRARHVDR